MNYWLRTKISLIDRHINKLEHRRWICSIQTRSFIPSFQKLAVRSHFSIDLFLSKTHASARKRRMFRFERASIWKHLEDAVPQILPLSVERYVAQRKVGCSLHAPAARWTFSKKIFSPWTNCIVAWPCRRRLVHMLHHLDGRNCSLSIISTAILTGSWRCPKWRWRAIRACKLENSPALTGIF